MRPPLMAEFMGCDEVGEVDISRLHHALDETDGFRVRNRVSERLREGAVAGKFEDSELRKLIRAEDAVVVVEAGARTGEHVIEVIGMVRIVVDLKRNIAVRAM